MNSIKEFTPLSVSSKFAICGLPLRLDTYKTCGFGCKYCFAENRKVMEYSKSLQIANLKWLDNKLHKVLIEKKVNPDSLLEVLLSKGITLHCGGMSDPFQPLEATLGITKQMIDICNKYNVHILFSTKSDTTYDCDIRPELHSFQLSVTNCEDRKDIEPNVPWFEDRFNFYVSLKERGFKVGIRVQPFIPNVTTINIIDYFADADNFTLEGIKIVPQNSEHKDFILDELNLKDKKFTQMGLLNLDVTIRREMYEPWITKLSELDIPYSIADNDLHYLGTNECCCGDRLIHTSTTFNNTAMSHTYGRYYTLEEVKKELGDIAMCKCNQYFTSNRQEGCRTVNEFYDKRFGRATSPFSPLFQKNFEV